VKAQWPGWWTLSEKQLAQVDVFQKIAADIKKSQFSMCCVMGMGGSQPLPRSSAHDTLAKFKGFPELQSRFDRSRTDQSDSQAKVDLKKHHLIVQQVRQTLEPKHYNAIFLERIAKKAAQRKLAIVRPY